MKKMFTIIAVSLLAIIIIISIFIISIQQTKQPYSLIQVNNLPSITLPIDNPNNAIKYSISLDAVEFIIENSTSVPENFRQYEWSAVASRSQSKIDSQNVWYVGWFKGKSCYNYGYQFVILENGTLLNYNSGLATCE